MQLDTIIQGGRLVTATETTRADLGIRGEKIVAVAAKLTGHHSDGANVIDARGRYVIPGGLDVHVHLALPFCGTVSADDYDSGTRAAACGGVTTLIDFAIPYGKETLQQAVDNWRVRAEGKACVAAKSLHLIYRYLLVFSSAPSNPRASKSVWFRSSIFRACSSPQASRFMLIASFVSQSPMGFLLFMVRASSNVVSISVSRSTTLLTSPRDMASSADIKFPVSINS